MFEKYKEKIKNALPPKRWGRRGLAFFFLFVLFSMIFFIPASALTASNGFVLNKPFYAYSGSIQSKPIIGTNMPADVNTADTVAFVGLSGNNGSVGFYRPLVVDGKSGNSAMSYTVTVTYTAYYFNSNDNKGFQSLSNTPNVFVNNVSVAFERYSENISDSCIAYGGRFSFEINSNTNFSLVMYTGKNNYYANQLYYHCYFDVVQNDGTSAIIDNQNSNTDRQIEAENNNTQSIIDNQNSLAEQEKNETQQSGNNAVEGTENIPDKSQGFISALGGLVTSLSYDGTECSWKFPKITIPAIPKVMSETVLCEEKDIDFSYWVNKIPANILSLVRNLFTIAIVVFCFKELYDTISYVLTLKGGNADE